MKKNGQKFLGFMNFINHTIEKTSTNKIIFLQVKGPC
jgi:hypothetical protein